MKQLRHTRALLATSLAALIIPLAAGAQSPVLSVVVDRGADYTQARQLGPISTDVTPHIAIWLETAGGAYVSTVFVSLKDGKQDFWAGDRVHPLPLWNKARGSASLADAVTGPSPAPKAPQALEWKIKWPANTASLVIRAEVNTAGDFNSTWPAGGKDVWGQPSLLWEANLDAASLPQEMALAIIGQASGIKGEWKPGTAGMDKALGLVRSIRVLKR